MTHTTILAERPRLPRTLVAYSAVWLVLGTWSIRVLGFSRTLRFAHALMPRAQRGLVSAERAEDYARGIAEAAIYFPWRTRCLEQSVALYMVLLIAGLDASLRLGVEPFRRSAHAWVEHDGTPLNERDELIRKLAVFPSCGV